MTLIQIGALWLNMDRVAYVCDLSSKDSAGQTVPGPVRIHFDWGETLEVFQGADALRSWLGSNGLILNAIPLGG